MPGCPLVLECQPLVLGSDPRAAGRTASVACRRLPQVCRTRAWWHGTRGSWGPRARHRVIGRGRKPEPGNEKRPLPVPARPSLPPLAQLATKTKWRWPALPHEARARRPHAARAGARKEDWTGNRGPLEPCRSGGVRPALLGLAVLLAAVRHRDLDVVDASWLGFCCCLDLNIFFCFVFCFVIFCFFFCVCPWRSEKGTVEAFTTTETERTCSFSEAQACGEGRAPDPQAPTLSSRQLSGPSALGAAVLQGRGRRERRGHREPGGQGPGWLGRRMELRAGHDTRLLRGQCSGQWPVWGPPRGHGVPSPPARN